MRWRPCGRGCLVIRQLFTGFVAAVLVSAVTLADAAGFWVLSSLSLDNDPDLHLFAHWFEYHASLGIPGDRFAILIHISHELEHRWQKVSEVMSNIGIAFNIRAMSWYSGPWDYVTHHAQLMKLQDQVAKKDDWVIFLDGDEFLALPPCHDAVAIRLGRGRCWRKVPQFLNYLDSINLEFAYCVMVDRLSEGGEPIAIPDANDAKFGALAEAFPRICDVTASLQKTDVRKVCFYKTSVSLLTPHVLSAAKTPSLKLTEFMEKSVNMPVSTLHHFKWTDGIVEKLSRRIYGQDVLGMLDTSGKFPVEDLCWSERVPDFRGLEASQLVSLMQGAPHHILESCLEEAWETQGWARRADMLPLSQNKTAWGLRLERMATSMLMTMVMMWKYHVEADHMRKIASETWTGHWGSVDDCMTLRLNALAEAGDVRWRLKIAEPGPGSCLPPSLGSYEVPGGRGCVSNCLDDNKGYMEFAEAWRRCGLQEECAMVVFGADGLHRLRRGSDPPEAEGTSRRCARFATKSMTAVNVGWNKPASELDFGEKVADCRAAASAQGAPQPGCGLTGAHGGALTVNMDYGLPLEFVGVRTDSPRPFSIRYSLDASSWSNEVEIDGQDAGLEQLGCRVGGCSAAKNGKLNAFQARYVQLHWVRTDLLISFHAQLASVAL
eukprot:TRINITY_DN33770_c0_g1_i2.p1 TRINITY_DN33770_c0_g1~~TRINITY_DN33770_c0_g1_i2.p1  ORF type:complete len:662 (-),score=120.41 TRINITY_DN33770_c0_g1_i2:304-2289(-)